MIRSRTGMDRRLAGHCEDMDDEKPDLPTTNQPLNGPRRPTLTPVLGVIGVIVLVAVLVLVLTWTRYHT